MLKLDNNLLDELGLGSLPEDQKRQMLQHIYETLELRVGTQLANQMTDKQLEEFERFIDAGGDANQAQALQWLESNLPNYKQVVQETFDALKVEVKQMAPQLLAAAAQQPAVGAPQTPVDPMVAYQTPPTPQYQAGAPAPQSVQPAAQPQPAYAQPQQMLQTPQTPPPPPTQVMPSQQPADNQSWQPQPVQPQQMGQQPLQQPPAPAPSFAQPQPTPIQPAPQYPQPPAQDTTTQPAQPSWQPQPTQPAPQPRQWQPPQPPVDPSQQPPQAT